uniref:STAS domain-containing protein n=1 Tax=Parastrongyloides trichosuri TaxID=131310 RepID=A0A0N4ZZY9_PARTI
MNQETFNEKYGRNHDDKDIKKLITKKRIIIEAKHFVKTLPDRFLSLVPISRWLPKYKIKEDLHSDVVAGITSGIMAVPQSMAYSSLAGVPPIYGLYSTFFAAIIYMIFGTSKHLGIGVFAVVSMMTGSITLKYSNGDDENNHIDTLELISTIAFTVGVIQLVMGLLRLNFIATYMSDALISGFTTGSACHVFMSQLSKIFGYKIPKYSDAGMLIFMLKDIIINLPKTNLINLGLAISGIVFLSIGKEVISPRVKKYTNIPIPFELILVIVTTILSSVLQFKDKYHIAIVDHIPQSFPKPKLPNFSFVPLVFSDCISIAIVCYILVISMSKLFARKHKYHIDSRQELYACSFMSLLTSIFPVYPTGASLSRSSVLEMTGVKTQLNIIFSTSLLLVVILWLGKFLEPLPMCILSAIVVVGLKTLFLQFFDLKRLWKINKFDFAIWIVAFLATVLGTVTLGLIVSLGFVVLTIVIREQIINVTELGSDGSGIYFKPIDTYNKLEVAKENLSIFKFEYPLHFANTPSFIEKMIEKFEEINKKKINMFPIDISINNVEINSNKSDSYRSEKGITLSYFVILDCSSISYIDTMGIDGLKKIEEEGKNYDIKVLFCNFNDEIISLLDKIDENIINKKNIFPSIQDALIFIDEN